MRLYRIGTSQGRPFDVYRFPGDPIDPQIIARVPHFLLLLMTLLTAAAAAQTPTPPVAPVVPHVVKSSHGDRVDEYHWLRDDDPQSKRPEILRHLQAENAYTAAVMAPLQPLQAQLVAEMRSRIKEDDGTPPVYDHGWWTWREFKAGGEYPVLMRQRGSPERPDPRAPRQVMLDQPARAAGQAYYNALPRLGGLGLTQRIRADQRFARLPVIGLTSLAGEDDVAKGKAAGIDDYQVKLDRDRLASSLSSYLSAASA